MRIKINAKNIAKKLAANSCKLSAFKKLSAKSYQLKAIPKANSYKLTATKGFTLVELLVTLSLFIVLTAIVLFSQSKFNGSILLTNLAYDVALTVRQAQTYGINVRETSGGSFKKAYGVHFDTAKETEFLIFSDDNETDKYEPSDSKINSYSIKRGNKINKICVISNNIEDCNINTLDTTFIRPNPDARFESSPTKQDITEAKIILSSANGDDRNVLVNSTGQISIGRGE